MHSSFIDSRGRVYNSAVFTNIQNFPLVKMIIKLYAPQHKESDLDICKAIFNSIQSEEVKQEFSFLNKKSDLDYLNDQAYLKDILKHLKENSKQVLDQWLKDPNIINNGFELLYQLIPFVKKPKQIFIVHSMIIHFYHHLIGCADPFIALWFDYDARCSGLQMLSLLFRSSSTGELCNLVGNQNTDVYSKGSEYLVDIVNQLKNIVTKYDFILNDDERRSIVTTHRDIDWVTLTLEKIGVQLEQIIPNFSSTPEYKSIMHLYDLFAFDWVNKTVMKFIHKRVLPYIKLFLIFKTAYHITDIIGKHPFLEDVIKNRGIFKKQIMTYFYNATRWGRSSDFQEFLDQYILINMLSADELKYFKMFLEKVFVGFIKNKMPDSELMMNLTQVLASKGCPITIDNEFFTITIANYIQKDYRISV